MSDTCGQGSTCVPRADQQFECLCLAGDNYNYQSRSCLRAKVFPGELSLAIEYVSAMNDPTSMEYLTTSTTIVIELEKTYSHVTGYSGSTVLGLRELKPTRGLLSRSGSTVGADFNINFNAGANINSSSVFKVLKEATKDPDSLFNKATFNEENLCDFGNPCELKTTTCNSADGSFSCVCQSKYVKNDFSDRTCSACESGKQAVEGVCDNCPFGRSGFNCNESWQLALVIVGSVAGVLLLISLIVIIALASRGGKKSSKTKTDRTAESPYANRFSTKTPLVNDSAANSRAPSVNGYSNNFASGGVPRIPRATTTSSADYRNNLEMTPSNSRQNLVPIGRSPRLYEDADAINPYAQSRPKANPYAQTRPQNNPYSSRQGHDNPSYHHGNGRRLY